MNTQILRIENLEKYYGNRENITKAVDGINLVVDRGEFVSIMGASGSGKTTLLNCISTIDNSTAGHIYINEEDITRLKNKKLSKFRREQLGFVFQEYNLLDTLSGFENISLALSILKVKPNELENRVKEVAEKLELMDVLNKFPYEMSGGQRQRIACARAVVTNPNLVLADEPTGALDSKSSKTLMKTFVKLNKELDSTILMVTHDGLTASYSNRVVFLKDGKLFTEISKGSDSQKTFFKKIIEVVTLLGGDVNDII
jgi:putative ABC transport system ATP-binding protein